MRAIKPLFLLPLAVSNILKAQDLTVDTISLSGAPALALSDSAPTAIAKPTGARQLGLSLLGGSSGADFAFETMPFWWHDQSIGNNYYDKDYGWNVVQQTFSISGARYEVEDRAGNDVPELSIGLSFDLVRGGVSQKFVEARKKFAKASAMSQTLPSLNPDDILRDMSPSAEEQKYADQMFDELVKGRIGWNVSFATAVSYRFGDNDYNGGELAKTGAWFVTSYTPDLGGDQISYMGVARFIDDQAAAVDDTYFDAGARLLWSLDKVPLSISGEYIRRFADKSEDSDRLSALIEYQFNKDLSIYASHGLTFDQASGKDEVFSLIGISFGVGKGPAAK